MLKIVYAGTPEFALPCLKKINESEMEIIAVLTQPDRPAGRGMKIKESPIKKYAKDNQLSFYQPEKIDEEFTNSIKQLRPDVLIVAAYGLILPKHFIDIFPKKAFNIHASILPRWRGAAPIQRAIMHGDDQIGVTIMEVVEKLDAGNIYLINSIKRDPKLTSADYFEILAKDGANLMMQHLNNIELDGTIESKVQAEEEVTYAKKISKSEACLNLENKAENIVNTIMSLNPFPISRISFRQKEVKIFHAELSNIVSIENQPGSISISEDLLVATADFYIKINSIQMSGGQMLTGKEFIKNYQLKPSEKFSNV
ncbi:MAG: methionyl-tRNA formyltransferase [Betaproteobacteria bacterium]|nr:methionyl-tRNA formyltransferase [Betaproteobacteria bacterium]